MESRIIKIKISNASKLQIQTFILELIVISKLVFSFLILLSPILLKSVFSLFITFSFLLVLLML